MPGMMSPRTHGPLSGVPVVPGVRYAPVIRPEAAPPPVPAASTPALSTPWVPKSTGSVLTRQLAGTSARTVSAAEQLWPGVRAVTDGFYYASLTKAAPT